MSRVLITGSSDGLGLLAGQLLAESGHDVTLHARNDRRAEAALRGLPAAAGVVVGDVSTLAGMRAVAEQAAAGQGFDAVIHNVGVYLESTRVGTEDGLARVFAVNVLAPYVLTAALPAPARLVYLTSGLHRGGDPGLDDLQWERRRWSAGQAYADSKLWVVALAFAMARRWPSVCSNAVDPGWVPTRMGGPNAPGDLAKGRATQVWLAVDEATAHRTGGYFYHQRPQEVHPATRDVDLQERFLAVCEKLSGLSLPGAP
ncbi:MAG TPA: SDR family NAD(P)-dependent oxidoreductase [Pseudonocardiaceae bacterium]|nr:SDR family NAD(P)-dependent oxidoreductase [Pseudonocardiaceae bacterium]